MPMPRVRGPWLLLVGLCLAVQSVDCLLPGLYCGDQICYDVLNVTRNATKTEVQKAYRQLARKHHPDRHRSAEDKELAHDLFRLIAVAYETLKDEESRKNYDYMLDNPDEVYRHYWYYYRHRVTPKVDVRIVILAVILMVSVVQYISAWHKYDDVVKYMSSQTKYRLRAKEIANERGYFDTIRAGKKRKDKEEVKTEEEAIIRAVIREFADIRGGYQRPSVQETIAVKIVLLPVFIWRFLSFHVCWLWRFRIRGQEMGRQEQLYLIRKKMKMSSAEFDCIDEAEKQRFLDDHLWEDEKFAIWKEAKEQQEKAKLLQSGQYKRMKRYMRRGAGQITFLDED